MPIFSPTEAPEGGMRLPPFGNQSVSSRPARSRPPLSIHQSYNDHSCSSPTTVQTLDHVQEENDYELPLSREAKSPAYPQGPVCIYDPYVFLYLEPNDTEASEFDVILNVAREVKNPFSTVTVESTLPQVEDATMQVSLETDNTRLAGRESSSEPQTAISDRSFRSAFESLPEGAQQQATPSKAVPEYIHILWDHNTNVVDDLLRLCELIDDRVQQQKKVLVHCQCGVSRSASLVVAYGLYKNPELTVHEAYNVVKSKSRWIGPNMSLIYQLSEFKSNIQQSSPPIGPGWRNPGPGWNVKEAIGTAKLRTGIDTSILRRTSQKGPSSAPFQEDRSSQPSRASSFSPSHSSSNGDDSTTVGNITPGPSSAPPDMIWSPSKKIQLMAASSPEGQSDEKPDFVSTTLSNAMDVDTDEKLPSLLDAAPASDIRSSPPIDPIALPPLPPASLPPPRNLPAGFSSLAARRHLQRRLPLRQTLPQFLKNQYPLQVGSDHITLDHAPSTPSLLSPRAAEFTASPFHRTAAGDLAGSSVFEQGLLSPKAQDEDPRSPAQRGEAPITRSIFGVL